MMTTQEFADTPRMTDERLSELQGRNASSLRASEINELILEVRRSRWYVEYLQGVLAEILADSSLVEYLVFASGEAGE